MFKTARRLGKKACPRVNDDQKTVVDGQKLNSGRPHDNWIFERLSLKKSLFFLSFYCFVKKIHLRTTTNICGRPEIEFWSST